MSNYKISVAICTYNGEKYFDEQIKSILNQSVKPNEIIICDDCSTDKTQNIIVEYKNQFPELIKFVINDKNLGYIKNFEKSVSLCSGDIIFLSDQDDIWCKHKIETIVNIFNSKPNVNYIFTDAAAIDEKANKLGYNIWQTVNFDKKKQSDFNGSNQQKLLLNDFFVTGAALAFKSDKKNIILPFPDNIYHDYWIAIVLSSINSDAGYCLDKPLIKYRIHEKQTIGLPELSIFDNEINSRLKVIFKSHYKYYNERIDCFTFLTERLKTYKIKNEIYFLINELINYYSIRNEMYNSDRKQSFLLIIKLIKGKYYSKFAYLKIYAVMRDLIEKVLINRKEKHLCQKL